MSDFAVRTEGLSKRYRIGHQRERYGRLTESLSRALRSPLRTLRGRGASDFIWALKDISLEVPEGEVVGIIGRNGAGKTTLLKILSRITEPTEGYAELNGRVGSLLEVGTGFHPELTGRENIFLNGAVLGMRRREVQQKFDEIVSFAEIEKFLDTPVKHYSSGMYVRLAFAVAAHLEPEILLVDEVLAVGDAAFQRKSLGRMGEVARQGRTVLFVSHNMAAILAHCDHACLLESGRVLAAGPTQAVVDRYLESVWTSERLPLDRRTDRSGDGAVVVKSLRVESTGGGVIRCSSRLRFTVQYEAKQDLNQLQVVIGVSDIRDMGLFGLDTDLVGGLPPSLPRSGSVLCITEPINLAPGACFVNIALYRSGVLADHVQRAAVFHVEADDFFETGKLPPREWSFLLVRQVWSVSDSEDT